MNEITITLTGQEAADYLQYKAEQINGNEYEIQKKAARTVEDTESA